MTPVHHLIADHFGGANVSDNDTLADLGADPLDCVELLIEIDEQIGVDLPDDAVGLETTVGEVVAMVERSGVPTPSASGNHATQASPGAAKASPPFGECQAQGCGLCRGRGFYLAQFADSFFTSCRKCNPSGGARPVV